MAFQTHEGVFAWSRLTMGCRPASQIQQTAYHNAMDKYMSAKYRQCVAMYADDMAVRQGPTLWMSFLSFTRHQLQPLVKPEFKSKPARSNLEWKKSPSTTIELLEVMGPWPTPPRQKTRRWIRLGIASFPNPSPSSRHFWVPLNKWLTTCPITRQQPLLYTS